MPKVRTNMVLILAGFSIVFEMENVGSAGFALQTCLRLTLLRSISPLIKD
jgi:hypothetical protein